jgi:hypothetical protein
MTIPSSGRRRGIYCTTGEEREERKGSTCSEGITQDTDPLALAPDRALSDVIRLYM